MTRSPLWNPTSLKHLFRHDWEYFAMAPTFQIAFPEMAHVGRQCRHCERLEYLSDDKRRWDRGAVGELRIVPLGHRD